MELPFKYIVLYIVKMLNDRNMPLSIGKSELASFFDEFIKELCIKTEERDEMEEEFNFEYELDSLLSDYYKYFDFENKCIVFDKDYIGELDSLLEEVSEEYGRVNVMSASCIIDINVKFLEIIGVNMNKDSYNYLLDVDKDIEESYNVLSDIDSYVGLKEVDTKKLTDNIRKLLF